VCFCCRHFRGNSCQLASLRIPSPRRLIHIDIHTPHKVPHLPHLSNVSDNGGSSSEITRVIGGPGIGDIRSRLVRLMEDSTEEQTAIKRLMSHRLSVDNGIHARSEWLEIVEGTHMYIPLLSSSFRLWNGISSEKRELLRSFLRYVQSDISKLSRPSSRFDFRNGSIGNFFLTGARLVVPFDTKLIQFFGSLESSIYLLSSIASLPESVRVVPIINTNHSTHIAAKLSCPPYIIVGQNQISHPTEFTDKTHSRTISLDDEDGTLPPGSLPTLKSPLRNMLVQKSNDFLNGRIERVFYVNPYGTEVYPSANPKVIQALESTDVLIYSIGSLFTSIIPCLIPKGVAKTILQAKMRFKIFLLNNGNDRETSGFTSAIDYVSAIVDACNDSLRASGMQAPENWTQYVTHLVYLRGCAIEVDVFEFKKRGIECIGIRPDDMVYDSKALERVLMGLCHGPRALQRRASVQI